MSRFRLFGRPDGEAPFEDEPSPPSPPGGWPAPVGPPPIGAGAPWPTGAARAPWGFDEGPGRPSAYATGTGGPTAGPARGPAFSSGPAAAPGLGATSGPGAGSPLRSGPTGAWPAGGPPPGPPVRLTSNDPRVIADPPTDPRGFPPVPAFAPSTPDAAEAAALAGAFAADYLSWDEDDPERRGRVLVEYLPTPGRDPARLGWSGRGRQRAEFALPGLVRPDGDGRVLVDVRVRVTPYRAVGEHGPSLEAADDTDVPGVPAAAPAPTGRGWRSLASTWIRLSVPITLDGGRLVVDAWEETLGEEPLPPARPKAPAGDDHTLVDDDPLHEPTDHPRPGGAW